MRGKNYAFYNAINKYGWENIIWEIIDTAKSQEELDCKEIYWIDYYNTYIGNKNGYNMTIGGGGASGHTVSKETKIKLSKMNKGKKLSSETKVKISKKLKGKYIGEKNANYGKQLSEERKIYLSNISKGRTFTIETKSKLSKANKGRIHGEEVRKNMSEAHKGKPLSEEHKKSLSKVRRGENNSNAKITEKIAKEIKIRLANGEKTKNIVNELNVTENIVKNIKRLNSWKHTMPELNSKIKPLNYQT
jgi:hypothetical protein